MFSKVDSDNSGEIEYSEFVVATLNEKNLLSGNKLQTCLLYTSPSPRDVEESRMPSSA